MAVDAKRRINYYQILGVQSNATQAMLDAAYRRQVRLHTGEFQSDALAAGPAASSPLLARVDEAYRQLSNPLKRWAHDEELRGAEKHSLTEEEMAKARKRIEGSEAWLSYQRREGGAIFIRVGWASDFTAIHDSLAASIPESGRAYNPRLNEWRIDPIYEEALAEIFANFRSVDAQTPPPQIGPTYHGPPFRPAAQQARRIWRGWPLLVIGGLVLAIAAAALFPANRVVPVTAQATATARALVQLYTPLESDFPEATPSPPSFLRGTLLYPRVNLRGRPTEDARALKLLSSEESYQVRGRLADSSWYVVAAADATGWVAAWTISVEGDAEVLPVYADDQPLPAPAGESEDAGISD